jgi:hypothetical protein
MHSILELQELTVEAADTAPELEFISTISTNSCTFIFE